MNETSKSTLNFCLDFIQTNIDAASHRTQCRSWLATAIATVKEASLSSEDFIVAELNAVDRYLSGASTSMTSVDVTNKLDTVRQLLP